MKYSQDFTWKAVEQFLPEIRKARELGMCFSVPEMLEKAAVKVLLSQNTYPQVYNKIIMLLKSL